MKWMRDYMVLLLLLGFPFLISGCVAEAHSKNKETASVVLREYSISFGEVALISSEQPVKVTIKNKGMNVHNFVIKELGIDSGLINPGESITLEMDANNVGVLHAECTLPGHKEAGMLAEVIVSKN